MKILGPFRLADLPLAEQALMELCRPFVDNESSFKPDCAVVQPDAIPFPQDQLLVHNEHMTAVLEKHHGSPVRVHVQEEQIDGDFYTRKIVLTCEANPDVIVEYGIVRLDFRYMDPQVKAAILARQMPLGAILIKHDVLRRIKPRYFLQFPPGGPVMKLFGDTNPHGAGAEPAFGRIGTIYCDEEPAIQVLEIVLNCNNGSRSLLKGTTGRNGQSRSNGDDHREAMRE